MDNCSKCRSTTLIPEIDGSIRCFTCGSRFYEGPKVTDCSYTERENYLKKMKPYEKKTIMRDYVCATCGDNFRSLGVNSKYCSANCKRIATKRMRTKVCKGCGELRWIAVAGLCMQCHYRGKYGENASY